MEDEHSRLVTHMVSRQGLKDQGSLLQCMVSLSRLPEHSQTLMLEGVGLQKTE